MTVTIVNETDGSQIITETVTDAAQGYAYAVPGIRPGTYLVSAGSDRDSDSTICDIEDACATEPMDVTVNAAGDEVANVELLMVFGVGQQAPPVENE